MSYSALAARNWKSLLVVLLAAVAAGFALPANAQPPIPGGEDAVISPGAVVSIRDLPEVGPPAPNGREKPHRAPDSETLNATKRSVGQAHGAPPPGPSTLASGSVSTVTPAVGALVGLRRSESGGWVPPDTQVAVSGDYIFEAVNLEGRIWTKAGGLLKTFDLASFFGLSASSLSDPKIRFDAGSGRWFVAIISYNNSFTAGAWNLAVSKTADPTGVFVVYTISTTKSAPDFPALAINDDKVVLTANAFRGNNYRGTEFVVINKSQVVAALPAATRYFGPPQGLFTIQPGHALTGCALVADCPLYMASVAFNSASSIQLWRVTGIPGVGSGVSVATTSGIPIGSLTSPPDAQQHGTSTLIATNDNRLLEATYRDDATGGAGALWVSANSACVPNGDTTTRACMRFIQLAISATGAVTKPQDFDFGQSGFYYYFPAIQTDGAGNLIAVFSGSSSATYAGVYASGQKATDFVNSFQSPPIQLKSGENSYTPFANRWGDYSSAALDPASPSTVWVAGEYVDISGGSEWGTFIAPVQIGP
jgi:hypothetical protein